MSVYVCNAVPDAIPDAAKAKIAADITNIHCEVTGAPSTFVHAFFFEDAPQLPIDDRSVFLFGCIQGARTPSQERLLTGGMRQSIHAHAGVPLREIVVAMTEMPASWLMEGGQCPPAPGDEAHWLKARAPASV